MGYELHWVPERDTIMGKILHIDAGKRLSLQVHDKNKKVTGYSMVNVI